jgi:transposase
MAREAPTLWLSPDEEQQLRKLAQAASTPQAFALRARIILHCAVRPGVPRNDYVAEQLGCHPDTISKWRRRFQRQRLDGLFDLPRSGRPAAFSPGRQA